MLGYWEILLIFLLVLLIFGGKKIPEVARGLGKGIREFRKAKDEITESFQGSMNDDAPESDAETATAGKKSKNKKKKKKKKDSKKGKNSGKGKKDADGK
jgi:sec-independent protein translocase protein TatA